MVITRTFAELGLAVKGALSHRSRAMRLLIASLPGIQLRASEVG